MFVHFMVVSDRKVNPVLVILSWLGVEVFLGSVESEETDKGVK